MTQDYKVNKFKKIREAFPLFEHLVEKLNLRDSYICGGSLFRVLNNLELDCDVDLYFCSLEEFVKTRAWFNNHATKICESEYAITYSNIKYKDNFPNSKPFEYQLIKKIYKDCLDILSSFDLNISCTAYNGINITGYGYKNTEIIILYNTKCPIRTLSRIIKFSKYLPVSPHIYEVLLRKIKSSKYDEIMLKTIAQLEKNERFY